MKKIYAYTTATYRGKGWLKIGETTQDSAEVRVAQQDGTANPEPLEIEKIWDVPLSDKQIHSALLKKGFKPTRIDKAREWFECTTEDVDCIINVLLHGVDRPHSYKMRDEQIEGFRKAVDHFENGGRRFLMNAKMRYGKTFTAYQIAKHLARDKSKFNVLILTYKPAVNDGWLEDLTRHIDFDGWNYFYAKQFNAANPIKLPKSGKNVLFASFQDINDLSKDKWKKAKKYHYDLVIVDETHFGAGTFRARTTLSAISHDLELHMSGTPLELLASGEFTSEETYNWSYIDEQQKRKEEENNNWKTETYRWLPPMEFHTFEVCEDAKKLQNHYSDVEGFTMTKLFASDDGETFKEEASVKLFVDQFFGRNVRHNHSPIRVMAADHMLWVMSNVAPVNAMTKLLEKMNTGYHVINVAGDNINDLTQVKKEISFYPKTITITCGRFNTGVTVPEWDMVAMLNGGGSDSAAETYFQTVFRVQSPDQRRKKDRCVVIDFNPQRCLAMSWLYSEIIAKNDQSTQSVLRSFLEFAPIHDHTGNSIKRVEIEQVMGVLQNLGSAFDSFGSSRDYDVNKFDVTDWSNVEAESGVKKTEQLADSGVQLGKNYAPTATRTRTAMSKDEIAELKKRISSALRKIPVLLLTNGPFETTQDILNECSDDDFETIVGLELDLFKEKCYNGAINMRSLDRKIADWNLIYGA